MNHEKLGLECVSNHLSGVVQRVLNHGLSFILVTVLCAVYPFGLCGQNCVPQVALSCEDAYVFCSPEEMHGYTCQNTAQLNTQGPTPLCPFGGVPNNLSWWAFVAGDNVIELEIDAFNCTVVQGQNGAQVGIYGDCQFIESVACMPECFTGKTILTGPTVPCQVYYVFIDGCNGSVCEFTVQVIKGMSPPAMDQKPVLDVQQSSCLGEEICAIATIPGGCATDFLWTLNGINSQQNGDTWCNTFQTQGSYVLCVKGILGSQNNVCEESEQVCVTIEVERLSPIEYPKETICYEDRNGLFFKECATPVPASPGIHRICCQTVKPNGCIQEVCKEYHVQYPVELQTERKVFCDKRRVDLPDGRRVNDCGDYFINIPGGDKYGCDSSVIWQIIFLEPELEFQSPECNNDIFCVEVDAIIPCLNESISYNHYWLNSQTKDTISYNSAQLCIEDPGQYCYVVQMLGDFESCGLFTYCYNFPNSKWVEWSGMDTVCISDVHIEKISYTGEDIPNNYRWSIDGGTIIEQPTDTTISWIANENISQVRICAQASQGSCKLLDTCVIRNVLSLPSADFDWHQDGYELIFKPASDEDGNSEWTINGSNYQGDSVAVSFISNQTVSVRHKRSGQCGISEKIERVSFLRDRATAKVLDPDLTDIIVQPIDNNLHISMRSAPYGNYSATIVDRWGRVVSKSSWLAIGPNDFHRFSPAIEVAGLYYLILTSSDNHIRKTHPFVWMQ